MENANKAETDAERGELSADGFLSKIVGMTSALIKTYEMIKGADTLFPSDRESVGKCTRCGGAVTENKKGFCCSDKACNFAIWKENRFFAEKKKTVTKAIVAELLKNGKVALTGGYSEKTGKTYDCVAGLMAIIRDTYEMDPYANARYLFCGKGCNSIKGLYFDKDGFCLLYKRLDSNGKFQWPRNASEVRALTRQEFRWRMEGLAMDPPKAIRPVLKNKKKNF